MEQGTRGRAYSIAPLPLYFAFLIHLHLIYDIVGAQWNKPAHYYTTTLI